jgi:hypothetical protein
MPGTIDHVAFSTSDLDQARLMLAEAGLSHTVEAECQWPGADGEHIARCVSVVVEDGYLDVIERRDALVPVLRATAVVLRTDDHRTLRSRLMAEGVRCARPYQIVRRFRDGAALQRYTIFGIDVPHRCGLPQAVIETDPAPQMSNITTHPSAVASVIDAAALFGIDIRS